MIHFFLFIFSIFCWLEASALALTIENFPKVTVGVDVLFGPDRVAILKGRKIGLITNHTAINKHLNLTSEVLKSQAHNLGYTLVALFAPEHGIDGAIHAETVFHSKDVDGMPIYSLHGETRRPTTEMLQGIDTLIYDIQDIGSRSYTYSSTLFYAMEEAAKRNIEVIVLDRPNPLNGIIVDGPMLEDKWRSFVGYINVPYCHGMTMGELAQFFNVEYKVGCKLTVIPMKGWRRSMTFQDTGLTWIPTSPYIPESSTVFYYPTTGILGEIPIVNIGIGYTLPFKVVGAPWIDAKQFAKHLNAQKFPGVHFIPFHYRPFYGKFAQEDCHGVQIVITNTTTYKPVCTQYLIIGLLKSLYPDKFKQGLESLKSRKEMFCKVNGTEAIYQVMREMEHIVWKLRSFHQKERETFMLLRKKYLIPTYSGKSS